MGTRKIVQCVGHVPTWILSPTTHMIHRASQELVLKPQKSVTMNNASVTQKKKKKVKYKTKQKDLMENIWKKYICYIAGTTLDVCII